MLTTEASAAETLQCQEAPPLHEISASYVTRLVADEVNEADAIVLQSELETAGYKQVLGISSSDIGKVAIDLMTALRGNGQEDYTFGPYFPVFPGNGGRSSFVPTAVAIYRRG